MLAALFPKWTADGIKINDRDGQVFYHLYKLVWEKNASFILNSINKNLLTY